MVILIYVSFCKESKQKIYASLISRRKSVIICHRLFFGSVIFITVLSVTVVDTELTNVKSYIRVDIWTLAYVFSY